MLAVTSFFAVICDINWNRMDQLKESNPSPKLLTSKNSVSHLCILSFRLYIDSVHKYKLSFGLIFFLYSFDFEVDDLSRKLAGHTGKPGKIAYKIQQPV